MTDIISFQEGREARIDGKPRDGRRNADWLHGWDTIDMQARLSEQSVLTPTPETRNA